VNDAASTLGTPSLVAKLFFATFLATTLAITWWAARRTRTTKQFYATGGLVGWPIVPFGGMLATTWVQIVKAILLLAGAVMMTGTPGMMALIWLSPTIQMDLLHHETASGFISGTPPS